VKKEYASRGDLPDRLLVMNLGGIDRSQGQLIR